MFTGVTYWNGGKVLLSLFIIDREDIKTFCIYKPFDGKVPEDSDITPKGHFYDHNNSVEP